MDKSRGFLYSLIGENNFYPEKIYTIAKYCELEDTLTTSFDHFEKLKNKKIESVDIYCQFLEIEKLVEVLYYQNNETTKVEFCGNEISKYLKEKYNTDIDSLDVEHDELMRFIEDNFHKEYALEDKYKGMIRTNPFAQMALDELLEKRNKSKTE